MGKRGGPVPGWVVIRRSRIAQIGEGVDAVALGALDKVIVR